MIDYGKSYGYPTTCSVCGNGTYASIICADCKVAFRVGKNVKTSIGTFRARDGKVQVKLAGQTKFVAGPVIRDVSRHNVIWMTAA